jgi:hypothetical protein
MDYTSSPIYLIFDTIVHGMPLEPRKSPANQKAKFAEVIADLGARKDGTGGSWVKTKIAKSFW